MVGAADGLFFLPIILSIIGPPAELVSHAHPHRLPTPTPPPSPQQQHHNHHHKSRYHHNNHSNNASNIISPNTSIHATPHHQLEAGSGGARCSTQSSNCSSRRVGLCDVGSGGGRTGGGGGGSSSRHHHNNNNHHHHNNINHNHHGGSNLSLSTITEEPPSSHSTHSGYSTNHEIVVEPQVVVETTTYGGGGNGSGGQTLDSGIGHVTTKVTATAKVKVELHTPLTSKYWILQAASIIIHLLRFINQDISIIID